jgi:hypothetical protein
MACRRVCRADQQQVERSNAPPLGEPTPQGWATRNRLKGAATRPWIEWVAGGFAGNQKKGQAKPNARHLLLTLGCSGRLLRLLVAYVRLLSVTATTDSVTI